MILSLLHPLRPDQLAELAALDRGLDCPVPSPEAQADRLMDLYADAPEHLLADACLAFGQGVPVYVPCETCGGDCAKLQMRSGFDVVCATGGPLLWNWHLPQSTFAALVGQLCNAERRRAVEVWRVMQTTDQPPRWVVTIQEPRPGLMEFPRGDVFLDQAAALREFRRRVLRLFPEVTREIAVPTKRLTVGSTFSSHGFVPATPDSYPVDCPDGFTRQTVRAWDFVPPDPPQVVHGLSSEGIPLARNSAGNWFPVYADGHRPLRIFPIEQAYREATERLGLPPE